MKKLISIFAVALMAAMSSLQSSAAAAEVKAEVADAGLCAAVAASQFCAGTCAEAQAAPGISVSAAPQAAPGISVSAVPQVKGQKAAKTETVTFCTNMRCKNCVKKINENIAFEKGVKDLKVSLEKQTITVTFDPSKTSAESLSKAISKLGYNASLKK